MLYLIKKCSKIIVLVTLVLSVLCYLFPVFYTHGIYDNGRFAGIYISLIVKTIGYYISNGTISVDIFPHLLVTLALLCTILVLFTQIMYLKRAKNINKSFILLPIILYLVDGIALVFLDIFRWAPTYSTIWVPALGNIICFIFTALAFTVVLIHERIESEKIIVIKRPPKPKRITDKERIVELEREVEKLKKLQ